MHSQPSISSEVTPEDDRARELRDQLVLKRSKEGASVAELAEEFDLGKGGVRAILIQELKRQVDTN